MKTRVIKRIKAFERKANLQLQVGCPGCGAWTDAHSELDAEIVCPKCGWHGYAVEREDDL